MGTVRIINSALIESQTPIQVSLESNQFFGFQTKTLVGSSSRLYRVSNNFNIGGTILHLTEKTLHPKSKLWRGTHFKYYMGIEYFV